MRIAMLLSLGVSWSREAALRLSELGHEVHAIDFASEVTDNYLRGRDELYSGAVAKLRNGVAGIHIIPGEDVSQFRYLRYAPRLRKICKDLHSDVLVSLWGGGCALISCASGVRPYAVFLGGGDILRVSGVQKMVSRFTLNKSLVSFANGKYFAEKARNFAPNAPIRPIYLGVDTQRFVPGKPDASPVVIICTRGFERAYNNAYLIEALAHFPDSVSDFKVVFTSAGKFLDGTRALADRILSPAMRARVQFLNGVTDDEMLENLRNAHIYTSVSRYDGTSISLLEALSCSLFPVLSDIPPNREWFDPQVQNGILVPLDQPAVYAEHLQRAIRDSAFRDRVGSFNRRLVLDRADGRKTMAEMAAVLEAAIGGRNGN